MRSFRRLFIGLWFASAAYMPCFAEDKIITKGDYEAMLTENGWAVKYKGIAIVCGSHFNINKPEWKGVSYSGRNLPGKKTAKVEVGADRIVITDTAPEIEGQIVQEIRLDASGVVISLKTQISKDIPRSPTEYAAAMFPTELFAGGRYRSAGLLGPQDWQPLALEKSTETGPGTKLILNNVFGLEVEGKGTVIDVESLQGPSPSFYDMRSRDYPQPEKNYWLLYSWPAGKGEMVMETRISARPAGAAAQEAAKSQVFILDGKSRSEARGIVVDKSAHEVEKAAAKELQQYLLKMGGGELPVIESEGARPYDKGVIYVGRGKAAQDGFLFFGKFYQDKEFDKLGYDGFILRSKGGNVLAAGKNPRSTVYAVYRLLEKLCCRFYAREMEVVPTPAAIEIPDSLNVADSAAFEWRAMSGTIDPMKCGLSPGDAVANVGETIVPRMMGIPPKGWFWHHTMGFLLPGEKLEKEHPEWLAQIGGQRKAVEPAVQQYCLSNPEMLRAMTDAVLDWVAKDPDRTYYPVHFGDVVKFCECEKCKAFYAEMGSVSDVVIWFDNQIAKEVAKKCPGKFVTILAYHSTRKAPLKVRPEPNLLIIFCAIVECQARPWSAPINMSKDVCKDLEDWIAIHPLGGKGIISFDYPTTYHFAGFPYPALCAYVENIRYYKRLGLRGEYVCGLGGWKHLEHLYSYVMSRIMWNPDQDMDALIDEFCKAWYGPAWKPMREYVEMLHRSAMESKSEGVMDCHAGPGQKFFKELYTREFLDKAEALFAQAESLADNEYVKHRIQKEKWGLFFVDLFLHGQKSGDLVPVPTEAGIERKTASLEDYRKVSELLRINRLFNRPWEIDHHRKYTLTSLAGIEPTAEPWWSCAPIKEIIEDPVAAHAKQAQAAQELGRKFVTLENPNLKAIVVQQLGGRIWRLYDKRAKQDILWRGTIPLSAFAKGGLDSAQYVNLGGYEEYAGEKFGSPGWAETYDSKPSADGKSLSLSTSLPSGLRLSRTISLTADGAGIEVDSTLENISNKAVKDVMLRAHPQVLRQAGTRPELRIKGEDGNHKPFTYTKGENFLLGKQLPRGTWTVKLSANMTLTNEFDPAQVAACLFYDGPEFFNLELFTAKKNLAPGEKMTMRHRYLVK